MTSERDRLVPEPPTQRQSAGNLVLPFNEVQFGAFVKSLLGRPQSITRSWVGHSAVTRDDVRDLASLIDQRVSQQNQGILAAFNATIVFSDNSAVELKSLEDLLRYNEPRPLQSRGLHMTWEYLVKFPEKDVPERQTITVSFSNADLHFDRPGIVILEHFPARDQGHINVRIEHTARTWGADIESLLAGFCVGLIKKLSPARRVIKEKGGWVVAAIGAVALAALITAIFLAVNHFDGQQTRHADALITAAQQAPNTAQSTELESVVRNAFNPAWPVFLWKLTVATVVALVVGIALIVWLGTIIDQSRPGFVLFTKASEREYTEYQAREQHRLLWLGAATAANLANGIVANVLFVRFLG